MQHVTMACKSTFQKEWESGGREGTHTQAGMGEEGNGHLVLGLVVGRQVVGVGIGKV